MTEDLNETIQDIYDTVADNTLWAPVLDRFAKEGIKLTLASDYEHDVAKAYGVSYDEFLPNLNLTMGGVPKRSAFVVDGDGVIQYSESSDDPGQLPNFEAIKAKLAELNG